MAIAQAAEPGSLTGAALYRKISLRLIPYMFLLYIAAYLDRVNVGYAALGIKADLHLSNEVYGTGAGLFFLGSALFDIPSNLIVTRVGPRRWMARIMVSWGVVAACMSLIHSATTFYVLRFLLGVSEAGFFPGMILYLTYWFPSRERARAVSRFMTATAVAGVVGGPVASGLLRLDGFGGLHGWQWLFLAEGLPTLLLGFSVLFVLQDRPHDAQWLHAGEKRWLEEELARDRQQQGSGAHTRFIDALKLPAVYLLAAMFFADQVAIYVINLWLPLFLHGTEGQAHLSGSTLALLSTIPYLVTALGMLVIGWSSDHFNERRFHVAACMVASSAAFLFAVHAHTLATVLLAFTVATIGTFSMMPPLWTWLTSMLEGTGAAGGIAIVTCIGGLGAFLGQLTIGRLSTESHNFASGLYIIAGVVFLGGVAALALRNPDSRERN